MMTFDDYLKLATLSRSVKPKAHILSAYALNAQEFGLELK